MMVIRAEISEMGRQGKNVGRKLARAEDGEGFAWESFEPGIPDRRKRRRHAAGERERLWG